MIRLVAADLDPAAVRAARRNLAPVGALVVEGDLYEPVPASLRGSLDLITANAPYVPTDEIAGMPPEARDHEPLRALDGGADGLDVQRRVLAEASGWLRPGGRVLVETSRRQAAATAAAAEAAGLAARVVRDERVDGTVVVGTLRVVSVGSAGPVGSADAVGGDGAAGGVEDGGGQRPAAAASTRATSSSAT